MPPKIPSAKEIRAEALEIYAEEIAADPDAVILSPVSATRALAEKYGTDTGNLKIASPVALAYYVRNGEQFPLVPRAKGRRSLAAAVRARRDDVGATFVSADGRATLSRWESVGASLAAALGVAYSASIVREAKALYAEATNGAESYVGRGTYASAESLRG